MQMNIYLPPCIRHAWHVIVYAGAATPVRKPFRAVLEFLLDLYLLAASVLIPNATKRMPGRHSTCRVWLLLGPLAATKNPTEIQQHKHCWTKCQQTPKGRSKGSQHEPQIIPKPSKLRPGAGLWRVSGTKHANIKSAEYLKCFDLIKGIQKNKLLSNCWV